MESVFKPTDVFEILPDFGNDIQSYQQLNKMKAPESFRSYSSSACKKIKSQGLTAVITTFCQRILTRSRLVLTVDVDRRWEGVGLEKSDICSLSWIFERKRNVQENEK
jgi:hypothetical protein